MYTEQQITERFDEIMTEEIRKQAKACVAQFVMQSLGFKKSEYVNGQYDMDPDNQNDILKAAKKSAKAAVLEEIKKLDVRQMAKDGVLRFFEDESADLREWVNEVIADHVAATVDGMKKSMVAKLSASIQRSFTDARLKERGEMLIRRAVEKTFGVDL